MTNLVDKIEALEGRIKKLLQQRNLYREDNLKLKDKLKAKESNLSALQDQVSELRRDNESLKTANAIMGSNEDKRETKRKINGLIREIDQCIVQLSE